MMPVVGAKDEFLRFIRSANGFDVFESAKGDFVGQSCPQFLGQVGHFVVRGDVFLIEPLGYLLGPVGRLAESVKLLGYLVDVHSAQGIWALVIQFWHNSPSSRSGGGRDSI